MQHPAFILTLCTIVLFSLPLLPALVEFIIKSDAAPLKVVRELDNNAWYFADGFRQYVRDKFPGFFSYAAHAVPQTDAMADRAAFHIIPETEMPAFTTEETAEGLHRRLLLSHAPLSLPDSLIFETEVYGVRGIKSGKWNQFRGLLAEGDIVLNDYSSVFRWIHSGGDMRIKEGCVLYGRASAEKSITLLDDCNFERLHAPLVQFGDSALPPLPPPAPEDLKVIRKPKHAIKHFESYWWIDGDLDIPEECLFTGNLIISGNVTIGTGSRIDGSIKSHGTATINAGASVQGSVFSMKDISVADHCSIGGPVVATDNISIGTGSVIGKKDAFTTVNARRIAIIDNAMVFGSVWASEYGSVRERKTV